MFEFECCDECYDRHKCGSHLLRTLHARLLLMKSCVGPSLHRSQRRAPARITDGADVVFGRRASRFCGQCSRGAQLK